MQEETNKISFTIFWDLQKFTLNLQDHSTSIYSKSQQNARSTRICCSQTPTSRPQGPNRASPGQGSLAGLDPRPERGGRRWKAVGEGRNGAGGMRTSCRRTWRSSSARRVEGASSGGGDGAPPGEVLQVAKRGGWEPKSCKEVEQRLGLQGIEEPLTGDDESRVVGVGEDGGGGSNGKKWEMATVWGLAHHLKVEEVGECGAG